MNRVPELYVRMFGAALVNRGLLNGQPQAWLDLGGTRLIVRAYRPTDELVEGKIALIEGRDGVRIELLERIGRAGSAAAAAPSGI